MNITELKSEGLKKEYKVSVSASEFEQKVDDKIKQVAKNAKLPGFRAGKAPFAMLKKKYKDSVMGEALDDVVRNAIADLVKEKNLRPATQPDVKVTSFAEGKDVEFEVSVDTLPEIKIKDFSGISLDKYMAEVPAEEVEKALNYLAQARKETSPVDRAAQKTDVVMIDFTGSVDGVEFKGGKGNNYPLELGSNAFIPGFEDQLIGAKAGDKIDVKVKFPDNYHAKDLAGKKALFKVDLKELRRVKNPEINDDFAKSFGSESLEKLKEMIVTELNKEYDRVSRTHAKRALLDVLADAHDFEVPAGMVDLEFDAIWKQFEQAKKNNQLDEDEKSKSEEELKKEYRDIAERRVRLGLLLAEIANQNKITLTQEDISGAIIAEARRYPGQEKVVFEYYQKNPQALDAIKAPLFEEKVVDFLLGQIKSDEKTVSVKELYDFNPDAKETKKKK